MLGQGVVCSFFFKNPLAGPSVCCFKNSGSSYLSAKTDLLPVIQSWQQPLLLITNESLGTSALHTHRCMYILVFLIAVNFMQVSQTMVAQSSFLPVVQMTLNIV